MINSTILKSQTYVLTASVVAPLALLLLLAFVPVSRAADVIPQGEKIAAADTEVPSDVENVKATAADGAVDLSWNVAKDNLAVKGYKIYYGQQSVNTDGGSYTEGPVDVGNKISFTVSKLKNGTKYYFAVTAYDAAGNESENYSLEASATPALNLKAAADTQAPQVAKAEAVDKSHVRVTFSEKMILPAQHPESAFTIKNDASSALLTVKEAVMDPADKDNTGKIILLTTADQEANVSYVLTAGIALKDVSNNPIISGTSDTAQFTGTVLVAVNQQAGDPIVKTAGPRILSVQAKDTTHLEVVFSEPMTFKTNARDNFIITEKDTVTNVLDVKEAVLNTAKDAVTLTTGDQKAINYSLVVIDATNKDGLKIPLDVNAVDFMGGGTATSGTDQNPDTTGNGTVDNQNNPPADTVAPEDVTNFIGKVLKKLIVTLSWKGSADTAGDLAQYMLYMSTDGVNYGEGIPVSSDTKAFDVTDMVPKVKYFFKLTAKDKAGNESKGVITTYTLPGTGPELGLFLVGSLIAGRVAKKRKNLKK